MPGPVKLGYDQSGKSGYRLYSRMAMDAFRGMAWLTNSSQEKLMEKLDIPFCKADLYYINKLAIILDKSIKKRK